MCVYLTDLHAGIIYGIFNIHSVFLQVTFFSSTTDDAEHVSGGAVPGVF